MRNYKVYFEFFGKKMHTTVEAASEYEASIIIRNRVNILKIVPDKKDPVDYFKNIFGI